MALNKQHPCRASLRIHGSESFDRNYSIELKNLKLYTSGTVREAAIVGVDLNWL